MAQWTQMEKQIPLLDNQTVNFLYPPNCFPMEVRCYLASWIEAQRWEDFDMGNMGQEPQALDLLDKIISFLQSHAQTNQNVVEKMRLQQISRIMNVFQTKPMELMVTIRDSLRRERLILSQVPAQKLPPAPVSNTGDMDHLVCKVMEIQNCRQKIHQVQEELNWQRQNYENTQGALQQSQTNGLDPQHSEIIKVQNNIQQLEYNTQAMSKKLVLLLQEAVCSLEQCQAWLINRIKAWRWEQHRATIGHPFDDNLSPLQTWCEQLLRMNGMLRQEVMLVGEPVPELLDALARLLQSLIQSSLVVEKQPPQVIKTQSKFSTAVRYLLGEKVAQGKPVMLKAQIVTENQARGLGPLGNMSSENVGEVINNTAILEHNSSSKSSCASFMNMSIKKIKRADRKGSESVTEEKFAFLFSTEISITGCDTPYKIHIISVPVVVIVHGSQDSNAMATVIWDCAFSEPDRVPFMVPERVPWKKMCVTLNRKFMSEVQTDRCLDSYNQHFLAQKIFDNPDIPGDYSNMPVSWVQFNKEVLPGRPFTFWQWFEGVMELSKKYLKSYWTDGLIFGFIGKQHLHLILKDKPTGTFLLRFSDSEIGGITIAYVAVSEHGGQKIQNIQPFTKRDLEIRCLGDRIQDIDFITHVYPDSPKNKVFSKYYTVNLVPPSSGYLGVSIHTKVETSSASPTVPSLLSPSDLTQGCSTPLSMDPGNGAVGLSPIYNQPSWIYSDPGPLPFPVSVDAMEQEQDMDLDKLLEIYQD